MGVICDKSVPVKLKVNIYQTVIKPTTLYGAECWAKRKKHILNKTEMTMLCWIHGISLNKYTRSETVLRRFQTEAQSERKKNCGSCYQMGTQLVWTHIMVKRPWRHHKNYARQGQGYVYTWKEINQMDGRPNDGRQENVVNDGGNGETGSVTKIFCKNEV